MTAPALPLLWRLVVAASLRGETALELAEHGAAFLARKLEQAAARKAEEEANAVGGLRHPWRTVTRMPILGDAGHRVATDVCDAPPAESRMYQIKRVLPSREEQLCSSD